MLLDPEMPRTLDPPETRELLVRENAWLKRTLAGVRQSAFATFDLLSQLLYEGGVAAQLRTTSDEELLARGYSPEQIGILRSALVLLRNFSWVLAGELAGCARPHIAASCQAVADQGIRTIITLTEDPLPSSWTSAARLDAVHIPIPDMGAPTPDQLEQVVAAIDASLRAHKPVVAHCLGGIGRTGTVLAAYLVHRGLSAEEAITHIRRLRHPSIETAAQEAAIKAFARRTRA